MKFSELQQQLQEKFGIDHLADIARELGVSPQAVSNWKARDRVPYKYVVEIRKRMEEFVSEDGVQNRNGTAEPNHVLTQYAYPQHFGEDTISLMDILLTIVKHFRIIIITPIIICLITIIHVQYFVQPVYVSTAKLMSSVGRGGSQMTGLAAQFGLNLSTGQSESQWVYPEIVKSRTLARAMLKRKFNTEKYGSQKTLLQILTYGDSEPTVGIDTLMKAGVEAVIGMIKIIEAGSYYNLQITSPDPVFAKDFAVVLIEELGAHQREYNSAKIGETRQFIEDRIVETEKELNASEEALKDFKDRNRRIENSPALQLAQQRLSREVAVLTGVFTTLKQQLETTKIEDVKELDYVIVLDPPEAPLFPSWPNKRRRVIIAGFLGIGLGIILAFIKEYLENSDAEYRDKMAKVKSIMLRNFRELMPFNRIWNRK